VFLVVTIRPSDEQTKQNFPGHYLWNLEIFF
jgi:hypothetical protein